MKLMSALVAAGLGLMLTACATSTPAAHAGAATTSRASAAGDTGTVAGTFTRVGGPLLPGGKQPPAIPLMGTVTFSAGRHHTVVVQVGKTGRFWLRLTAGGYEVSGRSPSLLGVLASGATVEDTCTQPTPVTVVAGRTTHVSVVCAVP